MRKRLVLRVCDPEYGSWLDRVLCGWLGLHAIAPSEDEATYVYNPGGQLIGMLCERCRGLI